jgi:hypothetical protein
VLNCIGVPPTARDRDTTLQKHGPHLVDSSVANKPISRPMRCLHVELFLTLQLDKPHGRPRRHLGVAIVVLLAAANKADCLFA